MMMVIVHQIVYTRFVGCMYVAIISKRKTREKRTRRGDATIETIVESMKTRAAHSKVFIILVRSTPDEPAFDIASHPH
jgi:hypothetical protein